MTIRHILRRLASAVPTPRRNPFALGYLAVLLGTTLLARFGDPELVRRLQVASSSDAHNLLDHPLLALTASGLWVAGPVWMPYFWAFLLTVAPLERRVGGLRAAGVVAAGHIGATLVSQLVVVVAVASGGQPAEALDALDIGVSYGVLAGLGAVAGLLAPPGRLLALACASALLLDQILTDRDLVTGVGHPTALLIGIACWPALRRRRPLRARRRPVRATSAPSS
ncbi:rhomboid-like protein [Kitasatospora camelliae]|uniref:Rhomboid-like protein n=1 Tax=Kitasatospora camelliae TaxID=3156397 RepID=A0AAU8K1L8_9ACTN